MKKTNLEVHSTKNNLINFIMDSFKIKAPIKLNNEEIINQLNYLLTEHNFMPESKSACKTDIILNSKHREILNQTIK